VNKKDGSRRMCVDYRSLNEVTEREIRFNLFLIIILVVECPTQIIGLTSLL
jgi:hypothetical protein